MRFLFKNVHYSHEADTRELNLRCKLPYFLLQAILFKSSGPFVIFAEGGGAGGGDSCRHPTKFSGWEGKRILGNNQGNLSPGMAAAHQALIIILPELSKNHYESYLSKGMLAMRQNNPGRGVALGLGTLAPSWGL